MGRRDVDWKMIVITIVITTKMKPLYLLRYRGSLSGAGGTTIDLIINYN
jgi:hypothetical protein